MRCPEHSDGLVRFHRITNTEMKLAFTNENSRVESNDAAELMGLFNRADSSPSTAKSSRVMLYQPFFFSLFRYVGIWELVDRLVLSTE